jgi:simple sugar transport system ATP-binding protein
MFEGGEVHVIRGENGAGKSTRMNILAGILQPDAGEMALDGAGVRFSNPVGAAAGTGMVHQHFKLVASMSVAENLFLNRQPLRLGFVTDRRAMCDQAQALIARYRFDLEPDAPITQLSVGQRQRVEILMALAFDARLLILDEPTAVLTPPEVDELLGVIAALKTRGRTILFIAHKLREVKAASDRVTVLRHGGPERTRACCLLSKFLLRVSGSLQLTGQAAFIEDVLQITAVASQDRYRRLPSAPDSEAADSRRRRRAGGE